MELVDSQTLRNLFTAVAGEAISYNLYSLYARRAEADGYIQIARVFEETANQEKIHTEVLYRLAGGVSNPEASLDAAMPPGVCDTLRNLNSALREEQFRHCVMYTNFNKVALQEGFEDIAGTLKALAKAELYHQKRFQVLENMLRSGHLFEKNAPILWRCSRCGFVGEFRKAPEPCPVCLAGQGSFEALMLNLFA